MKTNLNSLNLFAITALVLLVFLVPACKKSDPQPPVNKPPVAEAFVSREQAIANDTITLTGKGTDIDGAITAYLWSQISGPDNATILNPGSSKTVVDDLIEGIYIFQLMVTDDDGATGVDTVSVKIIPPPCSENGEWEGYYGSPGFDIMKAPDLSFINNGIAQLTNSPWGYFYSSVQLKIPQCRIVSGDSSKITVRLKNPLDGIGAVAPYDVSLWLIGSEDTAYLQFLNQYPEYTALQVGNRGITNSTDLIHLFQEWTELTLEAKDKKLSVYMNGSLHKQIDYTGVLIGTLKEIQIGFKGSGSVDWVKLHSTKSGKLLMLEEFNKEGKSSVVWY